MTRMQPEPGEPPEQVPAEQPLRQHRYLRRRRQVDLPGRGEFLGDLESGVAAADDQHRAGGQGLRVAVVGAVDLGHRRRQAPGRPAG